jgi:hypothetical protein
VAGHPVEYCRIGIATADGWYVNQGLDHCQGDDGSVSVETETLALTWTEGTPDPAFVITVRRRTGEPVYLDDQQTVGVDRAETESTRLCVVPAKGPPRCGPESITARTRRP